MKKFVMTGLFAITTSFLFAQKNVDAIINSKEVQRIENVLASDEMRGRKVFTPDLDKAADFIAAEFKSAGLQTWNNSKTYRQEFSLIAPKQVSLSCTLDNVNADEKSVLVVTSMPDFSITENRVLKKPVLAVARIFFQKPGN